MPSFKKIHCDVFEHGFLLVYPVQCILNLDLQVFVFHWIWEVFSHYSSNFFVFIFPSPRVIFLFLWHRSWSCCYFFIPYFFPLFWLYNVYWCIIKFIESSIIFISALELIQWGLFCLFVFFFFFNVTVYFSLTFLSGFSLPLLFLCQDFLFSCLFLEYSQYFVGIYFK